MRCASGGPRSDFGRLRAEDGTSLIELVVGMSLLSIFMAMFTAAVVAMNNSENKAQAVNITSSQLNQAYLSLDKLVRYATAISAPGVGTGTGDWYVELQSMTSGTEKCTQLSVKTDVPNRTRQLWRSSWSAGPPVSNLTATPIASWSFDPASGPPPQPFVLQSASTSASSQQLTINLAAQSGSGTTSTTSMSTFTFTALNSPKTASSSPSCQQQGRP